MNGLKKKSATVIMIIEYDHHDVPFHSYVIMNSKQKYPMACIIIASSNTLTILNVNLNCNNLGILHLCINI